MGTLVKAENVRTLMPNVITSLLTPKYSFMGVILWEVISLCVEV